MDFTMANSAKSARNVLSEIRLVLVVISMRPAEWVRFLEASARLQQLPLGGDP